MHTHAKLSLKRRWVPGAVQDVYLKMPYVTDVTISGRLAKWLKDRNDLYHQNNISVETKRGLLENTTSVT